MTHPSHQLQPGLYGKLPSNGDFVSRRLPTTFVEPWDRWLQESIADSRDQLGERWLDTYLTSPVWRFVLAPGAAGQSAWAGLLMPSVDRVGRYFPLTLACPLPAMGNPLGVLASAAAWYDAAETLLLTCLEQDLALADFDQQITALGPPPNPPRSNALGPGQSAARRLPLPADLAALCPSLLHQTLGELFFAYSLWWSNGSEVVEPSVLLCQGLPPSAGFAGMLTGEWDQWGWEQTPAGPIGDVSPGPQGS
ncbi:type VI secretion system-associated protein TagF [Candidatus Thiosymbion oneisti]|uniref:type VI secretion system-associated protein TagF n=1 Tax=Candidatus Thiosymbion oneisti TaxID=589554 RepID=UPI000AA4F8BB|nr:type VI secretion system-associated protein TagF [Candidatus Thiosymbion oneisti]